MTFKLHKNASLQRYNTMAVPAKAQYLAQVETIEDTQQAVSYAKNEKLDILILGEGSNTLFTKDYQGMVILNRLLGIELLEQNEKSVVIKVSAGENWHRLVAYTMQQGWYGLENLALIPGLVGAAPIQNIGAYGVEVKDSIVSVDFLGFDNLKLKTLSNSECQFGYRDSIFKQAMQGLGLISSVTFCLSRQPELNLSYPALSTYLAEVSSPTAQDVFDAVVTIRTEKLPLPEIIPNLGSFFKNPVIDTEQHQRLKKEYPNLVSFPYQTGFKLAAAWLIDTAGWKSKTIDLVRVHNKQALVIINPDKVEGEKIVNFANQLRSNIHKKFGITLEIEPKIV